MHYVHSSWPVRPGRRGIFDRSIIPIHDRNGLLLLNEDEELRPETNMAGLARLDPAFEEAGHLGYDSIALQKYYQVERIEHVHTAGNSCGIVDGATTILIGNEAVGKKAGLRPRAKIRSIGNTSVDPTIMLTGAVSSSHLALERAGMKVSDIDLWECNEAFAAIPMHFQRNMSIPMDQLNVNGGAIAMGHPLGATGGMLLGKLLDELERRDLQTGLVTMCVGSGMGVATIIERV